MATTQYIGARYMPLFFTNPDDNSNNWKSGVVYDPLTIVTDANQSYTSKIPVPASVGRPSENPAYWILTGAYNAQVEQYRSDVAGYRDEVQTFDGRISAEETATEYLNNTSYFKNKRIVVYGDSSGTFSNNFVDMLGTSYGLDITNRCVGGSSLSEVHGGIASGLSVIQGATDLDLFDIALIVFGINDWQNSCFMYNWINAIDSVCEKFAGSTCEPIFIFPWYCYRLFEVYAAEGGTSKANRLGISLPAYIDNAIDHLAHYGAKYINLYTLSDVNDINYSNWLVNNGGIYVHANAALSEKVCRLILSGTMNNGKSATFEAENLAGRLYNNTPPLNGQLTLNGFTIISRKTVERNMIACDPLEPEADTLYRIRGYAHANAGYLKIRVYFGSTYEDYTVVAGSKFDIYTHAKTTQFYVVGEFFENSSTFAYLESLEIYASQPFTSEHFNLGLQSNAQLPANYPAPTVYIENGCINIDPVELIFTSGHSAWSNIGNSPIWLPNNTAARGLKIGTAPAATGFDLFNRGRFIMTGETFASGDHICYAFPPIRITGSTPGYTA